MAEITKERTIELAAAKVDRGADRIERVYGWEVERAQHVAERRRRSAERVAHEPEDADGAPLELVVAVDPREAEEDESEHRAAGRRRLVVEVLLPRDELLAV